MSQGTIIDITSLNPRWTFRYSDLAALGEGVILIVEPDASPVLPVVGSVLHVVRDDKARASYPVASVEQRGNLLGFGIRGIDASHVSRGALVSWEAGDTAAT